MIAPVKAALERCTHSTITDLPRAAGTATYTVEYPGDDGHLASSASVTVLVATGPPTLMLDRNGSVNTYGTTVTVTAHLGSEEINRTVAVWADPAGSDQGNRLLKRTAVDQNGNLSVSWRLTRNTVFSAVFAGDVLYRPATAKSTLYTRVSVSTSVSKQFQSKSGYYYIHKSVNPVFTTTMTAATNRKQRLVFETYSGGKWHTWKTLTLPLSSSGKSTYTLTGSHRTGVKYRVRAAYLTGTSGDSLNYTTYGSYRYFTFAK